MEVIQNWQQIITQTLSQLSVFGFSIPTNERTVCRWHIIFKKKEIFPHPNPYVQMKKQCIPKLFEIYPEAKEMVDKFASKNIQSLSSESLALHLNQTIIPNLFDRYKQEEVSNNREPIEKVEFMRSLHLTSIHPTTAFRWLHILGYKYRPNKKCYYTDKHEDPGNVSDRKKFICNYSKYELRSYVWCQISEEVAVGLENNEEVNLSKAFYEYRNDKGKMMREYHVDVHPYLKNYIHNKEMGGDLSVRKPPNTRPVIVIGQDESVFKQYSFSSKSWVNPNGERKLLPKSDGYSLMISAYCSRVFGFGLKVTNEQLKEINLRRT